MSYINNTSFDRVSEEANGDIFSYLNQNDPLSDLGFDLLFDESSGLPVAGTCDYVQFTESLANCVEPNELDGYLGIFNSPNHRFECDSSRALMNNLPMQIIRKDKKSRSNTNPIALSQSVGVGVPQRTMKASYKVDILYPLELFFRPRYKSDYFAQNGKSRRPRYVADRNGNHYITIQVPTGLSGQIRVDWLTIADKSGARYSMPYRFQQSNESADVPDLNPIFIDIKAEKNGTMKLYLVLIKSKQDELKTLQPLKPFRPFHDAFGMPDKNKIESSYPLNPKQLIQKYQLDQSQLAFTFCTIASDGKSLPKWDTTVFSTVLTEIPPESAKQRLIACPHCTHRFHVSTNGGNGEEHSIQETASIKRKAYGNANGQINKKQNSMENDLIFFN